MSSNHTHGVSATYGYDDLNRLTSVVDGNLSGSSTTSYTYDNANNVGTATYPNNIQMQFTYDTLNRVATAISQVSGYSYQRGPTGNLTNVVELGGRTVNWTYDGIYRLTNESIAGAPSSNDGAVNYSLDPVGNRSSDTSSLPGISAGSWGYNSDDEVTTESYDANGNVLSTGGKSFTYDSENHLMSMSETGTSATIVYDGDGNRVAKTVNNITTLYLVDDLNPTGYAQVVEELTANGTVERQYTYGLQRINENQPIDSVWTPSFYGYDGGGNVRQLTSAAGAVTDKYEYDAFGNKFTVSGTTPNNYLYRGEQYDPDLGLYYLRARYYNPATGRFMSRDPEEGYVGVPVTLHKYLYAGVDPVNHIDPRGRFLAEYAAENTAEIPEAKLIDIYGCVANAGLAAIDLILAEPYDPNDTTGNAGAGLGLGSTVLGCVSLMPGLNQLAQAGSKIVENAQWASLALGWLSCAANAEDVVNGLNDEVAGSPKAAAELSKAIEHLGGCVGTELGELFKKE
jgi:RHS repeat-associated protein